ncbi:Eco57I restriction-modification methylase [Antricoccus suffuscus]|uniref:Eco57I restriction-modification methylase n=1 Tax=Antricoccus suffuscus TaxID=1629062 RepID=A0A2T0ZX18_9ACTN|nr:Eco57I restriction-modification methylase domain-containing protein [Antricoccus suffuscus]PRZ40902.1 Eco57I restriction-modification methylase [Antricoccus suffuscus]
MSKKFDVVIGNPPYQEDSVGESTHNMPIYDKFMDAAFEVGTKVVLITPARFLFNAGYTPKAWNAKMLADEHLMVAHFEPDSNRLFPGLTDPIKAGIAVTYRDSERQLGPIGQFAKHPELDAILQKVQASRGSSLIDLGITNDRQHRYTDKMHEENLSARALMSKGNPYKLDAGTFVRLPFLFHEERPSDGRDYVEVFGLSGRNRVTRWLRRDYVTGPPSLLAYKVAVPAANGSGSTTDFFGVALNNPTALGPDVAVTSTFLTIGSFATVAEAEALLKYVKSKFARAMLGILKVTQHNAAHTWRHVPMQDFAASSDIDWSKSIPQIDQQLYAKYGLDAEEIAFIEAKVKPME